MPSMSDCDSIDTAMPIYMFWMRIMHVWRCCMPSKTKETVFAAGIWLKLANGTMIDVTLSKNQSGDVTPPTSKLGESDDCLRLMS